MTNQNPARETRPPAIQLTEMADFWLDFWILGAHNAQKFWQQMLLLPHPHDEHYQLTIPEPIAHAPEQDLFA